MTYLFIIDLFSGRKQKERERQKQTTQHGGQWAVRRYLLIQVNWNRSKTLATCKQKWRNKSRSKSTQTDRLIDKQNHILSWMTGKYSKQLHEVICSLGKLTAAWTSYSDKLLRTLPWTLTSAAPPAATAFSQTFLIKAHFTTMTLKWIMKYRHKLGAIKVHS